MFLLILHLRRFTRYLLHKIYIRLIGDIMQKDISSQTKPFSAFMRESLYGEGGYYTSPHRVGKGGDFYTSVSASKFFGGAIAQYILTLVENGALSLPLRIVELGAEKGYLLGDIALFLDALSENLLEKCEFITIEPLPTLALEQKAHFHTLKTSVAAHFYSFPSLFSCPKPTTPTSCFIIANEFFDSFPCEVIHKGRMLYIARDSGDSPVYSGIWRDIESVDFIDSIHANLAKSTEQVDFINIADSIKSNTKSCLKSHVKSAPRDNDIHSCIYHIYRAYIKNASHFSGIVPLWQEFFYTLPFFITQHTRGYFVSFDYANYDADKALSYNPRFYMQHNVLTLQQFLAQKGDFADIFCQADMTYDVDFTLLDTLLKNAGLTLKARKSQAKMLIEEMKILELLESFATQMGFNAYFKEAQKVKTLLHTMGERFMGLCYRF